MAYQEGERAKKNRNPTMRKTAATSLTARLSGEYKARNVWREQCELHLGVALPQQSYILPRPWGEAGAEAPTSDRLILAPARAARPFSAGPSLVLYGCLGNYRDFARGQPGLALMDGRFRDRTVRSPRSHRPGLCYFASLEIRVG